MRKGINSNHIVKMLQLLIYFVLTALVLTNIENNSHYNLAVGGKVAIDKNWWFTITGISKRFLNQGQTGQLYIQESNDTQTTNRRIGVPANLHKGEFCVDVSTYSEIQYDNATIEVCDSTFAKKCTKQFKKICDNVTEIECNIVPYTKCKMIMESVPYDSYNVVQRIFKIKNCTEGIDTIKHTKMMPECKNVTKQHCITKWKTDVAGKQVWAGNEDCEPVTWRECKLIPKMVDFKVPKISCEAVKEVAYEEYNKVDKTQITSKMICAVQHASDCRPITKNKCENIEYQECEETQSQKCEEKEVKIPKQIKEHKKKCLLPDEETLPTETITTTQQPLPTYNAPRDPFPVTTANSALGDNIRSGNEIDVVSRPNSYSSGPQLEDQAPKSTYGSPLASPVSYGVPLPPPIVIKGIKKRLVPNKALRPRRKPFKHQIKFSPQLPKRIQRRFIFQSPKLEKM